MLRINIFIALIDLLFIAGSFYVIKISKGFLPFIVAGWISAGFWVINLIYDFVKILTM